MTIDARLARRIEEHRHFAGGLPDVTRRSDVPQLSAYVFAIANCSRAISIDACDEYITSALVRIEVALPAALEELHGLATNGAAEQPGRPRPSKLADQEQALLGDALHPRVSVNGAAYEALFDRMLAYGRSGSLPSGPSPLVTFVSAYHELLHVRVHVGQPELEALNKVVTAYAPALVAADALTQLQRGAPPAFEPHGDASRLFATRLLPSDFQYHPPPPGKKTSSSTPAAESDMAPSGATPSAPSRRRKKGTRKGKATGGEAATTAFQALAATPNSPPPVTSPSSSGESQFAFQDMVENTVYDVPIGALQPHPENDRLFAPVDAIAQREFEHDVREHGVEHPLLVCGSGCASAPGTILRGHRRHAALLAAAAATVPVMFKNNLVTGDEVFEMIRGNLADSHARRLSEEAKFLLEEEARRAAGERRGRPRVGGNSVIPDGLSGRETAAVVAEQLKEKPSAVRDRKRIFGSPCSTPKLRKAVNGLKASVSPAAALVRQVEGRFGLARGEGADADKGVVQEARAAVDQLLAVMLAPESKRPRKPKPPTHDQPAPGTGTSEPTPAPAVQGGQAGGGVGAHTVLEQLDVLEAAARAIQQAVLSVNKSGDSTVRAAAVSALEMLAPIVEGGMRAALVRIAASAAAAQRESRGRTS